MIRYIILVTSLLTLSCSVADNNKDVTTVDIPLCKEVNEMGLSQLADSLSYIFLETNSQSTIGVIDKLIPTKKYLIVIDKDKTKSVFIFDHDGKFISKINKVGRSAEEYLSITDVAVDEEGERIFIVDCKFKKILEYNFDGEFIKKNIFMPVVSSIAYTGDNKIAAYCGFSKNGKLLKNGEYPNLLIVDASTAEIEQEYLYFDDAIADSNIVGLISNFTQGYNCATLATPLDNAIYTIKGSALTPTLYLNFPYNQERKLKDYIRKTKNNHLSAMQATELFKNSNIAYLMNCISSTDKTYIFYKCQNMYYYGFYDSANKSYIESSIKVTDRNKSMIPVYNDIDNTFKFMPISGRDSNLYYVIEPAYIDLLKGDIAVALQNHNFNMNSNPIISSVKLK